MIPLPETFDVLPQRAVRAKPVDHGPKEWWETCSDTDLALAHRGDMTVFYSERQEMRYPSRSPEWWKLTDRHSEQWRVRAERRDRREAAERAAERKAAAQTEAPIKPSRAKR